MQPALHAQLMLALAYGAGHMRDCAGPYAAIYNIWQTGALSKSADVPVWILVMCAQLSLCPTMHCCPTLQAVLAAV